MQIGVAGLGAMGAAIAARLMEVGQQVTGRESHVGKSQAAPIPAPDCGHPQRSPSIAKSSSPSSPTRRRSMRSTTGATACCGDVLGKLFIEMSTVRPAVGTELRRGSSRQGRGVRRVPGQRLDRARASRQAARAHGRRARGCGARRPILDQLCRQRRARRAGRLRRADEIRRQPAADGLLAGLRRGVRHRPRCRLGAISVCSELLAESNGANNGLKTRKDMIVAMMEGRDPGPTTFSIANAVKDLRTMVADRRGARAPTCRATKARARRLRGSQQQRLRAAATARQQSVYWSSRKNNLTAKESLMTRHARASFHHRRRHAEEGARAQADAADRRRARCRRPRRRAKREDDSGIIRFEIAVGKAYGALGMGWGIAHACMERAAQNPNFLPRAAAASGGRMVPNPAACCIRDAGNMIIGAVGISGDTGDNDEIIAVAGIEAAGLTADPGGTKK